jgi:hypothetical protein
MPNGGSWDRFWFTVIGFNVEFGRWPTLIRLPSSVLEEVTAHLGPPAFERLKEKLAFVSGFDLVAEDDTGATYAYAGPPEGAPTERPEDWFGVSRD